MEKVGSDISRFQLAAFAQDYFAQRKRGLFSRKYVPLAALIQFQREPLTGSLLRKGISNKDAMSIFKRVQSYMGNRGHEAGKAEVAIYILERGIKKMYFRDEIYCQIAKQMTNNPRPASLHLGWELLSLCMQLFSPNKGLVDWLAAFISDAKTNQGDDKVAKVNLLLLSF
jgi:hypothetical protein